MSLDFQSRAVEHRSEPFIEFTLNHDRPCQPSHGKPAIALHNTF
ncbi:MAG: hypothetical protein RBJ76_25635 [Stenomitos frigidus ULC029]